jgi:hypothetical protein
MRAVSNRALARQLGVSETAVRRAEKAGRIRREADGFWDPAKVKAAWSGNTNQAQQRPARSATPTGKRRILKPVPEAALGAVQETLREHGDAGAVNSSPLMVRTMTTKHHRIPWEAARCTPHAANLLRQSIFVKYNGT